MKKFIDMDGREATRFIINTVILWNTLYTANKVLNIAFTLVDKWNNANPDKSEISGCEAWDDNICSVFPYGVNIEDETIIFRDFV